MSSISFSVEGLQVLISGGSGGIGGAFAKAFLAHGAQVIVTDLQPASEDLLKTGARYESLDVTSDEAVEALAKKVDKLDVLIHCAGKLSRWEEHKPEVFRNIVDIHLFGNVRHHSGGCSFTICTTHRNDWNTSRSPRRIQHINHRFGNISWQTFGGL